jgi:hypothetical protein
MLKGNQMKRIWAFVGLVAVAIAWLGPDDRSWRGCWTKGATKSCLGVDYICSVILSQSPLSASRKRSRCLFERPIADCFYPSRHRRD